MKIKLILLFLFVACVIGFLLFKETGSQNKRKITFKGSKIKNDSGRKNPLDSVKKVALNYLLNELLRIKSKAHYMKSYCKSNGYSTHYCFIADMNLQSGKKRFFVFDFFKDSVVAKGLVAHGSCNTLFLPSAKFSNEDESSCSSLGKYKIGMAYKGRFGAAYKLYGLESSNSNAFRRNIVLHSYYCVPDNETPNFAICNSRGCPMVSELFLERLSDYIKKAEKPIVLWMIQ